MLIVFPQDFPQADMDVDVFMEIPFGFESEDTSRGYVLKLNKILYGLKQSSVNWFAILKKLFADRYYEQSDIGPCIFYRKDSISLCYVDDCIIITKKDSTIKGIVNSLMNGKENFELIDEGNIERYLRVEV